MEGSEVCPAFFRRRLPGPSASGFKRERAGMDGGRENRREDDPPRPSGDASAAQHLAMLVPTARLFLDYAGLLAPVAADTDQVVDCGELRELITLEAATAAQSVAWLLNGIGFGSHCNG
jgi:hypothetical protein